MIFRAVCPHCFEQYELRESLIGKTAQCRNCRRAFTLERSTETLTLVPGSNIKVSLGDSSFVSVNNPGERDTTRISQLNAKDSGILPALKIDEHPDISYLWNIGDVILGTYEVLPLSEEAEYAEGGVGVVQRVYHREWDMELAVKSPKQNAFATEAGKESYERECQTWIELGLHTNIVTCYMVRRIDGIPRIFAEFIPDGSLRDHIKEKKLYTGTLEENLRKLLDVSIQFAWGLEHSHKQGLLHLDVKPANVMISGDVVKVTDFGLAQATGAAEKADTGTFSIQETNTSPQWEGMTPGYCSPEQFMAFVYHQRGEIELMPVITLQSDIWSWAICVLSMFHGRAPCKKGGQTAAKVFELYLQAPKAENRPEMPQGLVKLMRHCFQEDPEKRPKSMTEISDRLLEIYRQVAQSDFPRRKPASAIWTAESINNRAVSMLDLDKPKETNRLLQQAASLQPWQPEVTYNQTLLAWRNGKITDMEAIGQLENLSKMRRTFATAAYGLGLIHRERGNPASALGAFTYAQAIDDRPVFRRMISATEETSPRAVRCTERLMIQSDNPVNSVYIEDREEQVLVSVGPDVFELREASTGKRGIVFNKVVNTSERLAISEDLMWEIVPDRNSGELQIRQIRTPEEFVRFRPIPWGGRRDSSGRIETRSKTKSYEVNRETIEIRPISGMQIIGKLTGHTDSVTAVTISPDEHWACTGGHDRTLRLWELASERCIRTFAGLDHSVDAVFIPHDNHYVITLQRNGSLRFWDVSLITCEQFRAPVLLCLVASSEEVGRRQAEMTELCETIRSSVERNDYPKAVEAIAKAEQLPNWETIRNKAVPWDQVIRHCVREKPLDAICSRVLSGHRENVSTVSVALDGRIAASAGRDNEIRIWNLEDGNCIGVLNGHYDWIRSIVLTQDTRYVISGSWDQSVRLWNIRDGRCLKTVPQKVKSLTQITLNPQGRILAIGNGSGIVMFWDILQDRITAYWQAHQGSVNSLRFSRDGRFLVTAGDDRAVRIWSSVDQQEIRTITAHTAPVAGAFLGIDLTRSFSVGKDGEIISWDLRENRPIFEAQGHLAEVGAVDNVGDDRFIVTASKDKTIRIWNMDKGHPLLTLEGHDGPVTGIGMNLAGNRFLSGSDDATVRIWDVFWRFSSPERDDLNEEAREFLRTLLYLYCDPDLKSVPKLDEKTIQRVLMEMEYRGFGWISPKHLKDAINNLINHWPGPIELK